MLKEQRIELTKLDPYHHLVKGKNIVEIDFGFVHAFLASLSVIIVSELGDKTFFIAAIMAMRHPRLTVFAGAMLALGLMTVLSGKCLVIVSLVFIVLTLFTCNLFMRLIDVL